MTGSPGQLPDRQRGHPTLDLTDYDTRNSKLNGLFALVLAIARPISCT